MSAMLVKTYKVESEYSDKTREATLQIYRKYSTEAPDDPEKLTTMKISSIAGKEMAATAASAGLLGGFIGAGVGGVVFKSLPGIYLGAQKGAAIGTSLGAALGLYVGVTEIEVPIKLSTHYQQWKEAKIKEGVYGQFEKFVAENENLSQLRCPITLDFPMQPVRTPNNHYFEKAALVDWMNECSNKGWQFECPLRGAKPYTKEDLRDSLSRQQEIAEAISKEIPEIEKRIKGANGTPKYNQETIVEGLRAAVQTFRENAEEMKTAELMHLVQEAGKHKLSVQIVTQKMQEIYARYAEFDC